MKYILMNEARAIELGIITENHHFRKNEEFVLFKKDMLTIWEQNTGQKTNEYTELTTPEALKQTELWN